MPHFTRPITQKGPLLKVEIGVSDELQRLYRLLNFPIPRPLFVDGLVDTGASITGIDTVVARALDLTSRGTIPMVTPSTGGQAVQVPLYDVSLAIPPGNAGELPYRVANLSVFASDELGGEGYPYHVLVGRDVLSRCLLVYNGQQGTYTLAF